ncbi:hypothetical protein EDB83DRAFT_2403326 [Lactarius deliciosus]|nr:hypothetical protein EDB83DRAFT_2403326 [Lactarius deliciosus]
MSWRYVRTAVLRCVGFASFTLTIAHDLNGPSFEGCSKKLCEMDGGTCRSHGRFIRLYCVHKTLHLLLLLLGLKLKS